MKKNIKIILGVVVLIIVVVLVAVFYKPASKGPIKIGVILPLTGDIADIGQGQKNAIELAFEQLKDSNIQLIFEDDRLQINDDVTAAQKLINVDKVDALIGPSWSGAALAVAPIAESNKTLLISPSASTPSLTTAGDYVFRVFPSDDAPVKMVADFAFNNLEVKKAAVLYDLANDSFAQEKNYIKSEFEKLGGKIVIEESFKTKDKDFKTQLLKIKNSEAAIVFFSAWPAETGIFLKQAKELNLKQSFISLDTVVEDPSVITIAKEAAEGLIYQSPAKPENKEHMDYLANFKDKYKKDPPAYTAEAYDCLILVVKAIKESNRTKESIKDRLYQIGQNYMGASGEITFDKNGDVSKSFILKTVKNGQFVPYEE
jgi:branched-chain amino acid transport system substrate-binding protein